MLVRACIYMHDMPFEHLVYVSAHFRIIGTYTCY